MELIRIISKKYNEAESEWDFFPGYLQDDRRDDFLFLPGKALAYLANLLNQLLPDPDSGIFRYGQFHVFTDTADQATFGRNAVIAVRYLLHGSGQ